MAQNVQSTNAIKRAWRITLRFVGYAAALWVITLIAVVGWTYLWPRGQDLPMGDVIICLGAGIDANGRLGPGSIGRATTCGMLFHQGAAPVVVFTGGSATDGAPSAAWAMAQVSGIPTHAVILEDRAQSTLQNALFTRPSYQNGQRVILVSEAFHLPRAWVSFRAFGARRITLYASTPVRDGGAARMLPRESIAIWFNAMRGAIYGATNFFGMPGDMRIELLH